MTIVIAMRVQRMDDRIVYEVERYQHTIWRREVRFGQTDRHCAGGAAFVEAAREQEEVAVATLRQLHSEGHP